MSRDPEGERMSELRRDPLSDRWVVIAPERGRRPPAELAWPDQARDPKNPFAGGMEASTPPEIMALRPPGSAPNTPGWEVRVIPNRLPALVVEGVLEPTMVGPHDRLRGIGAHEVIVETPDWRLELADLPEEQIDRILRVWHERIRDLRRDWRLRYQLIYRNQGYAAGRLVPHAHSLLLATPHIPEEVKRRLRHARAWYQRKERSLFADLIAFEQQQAERVIAETPHHIALCPYASPTPFCVLLLPLRACHDSTLMSDAERLDLARLLRDVVRRLRTALDDPAYQLALYNAPSMVPRPGRREDYATLGEDYRWHLEIAPRLAPAVASEALAGIAVNPVAPEEAAAFLRDGV